MNFFWRGITTPSPDPSPAPHNLGVSPSPLSEILNTPLITVHSLSQCVGVSISTVYLDQLWFLLIGLLHRAVDIVDTRCHIIHGPMEA